MEFQYVGVIIGKDLICRDGKIITQPWENHDKGSLKGWKNDPERADRIIRNIYRTLMTRGMDGCVVYCLDKELPEHIKKRIREIGF